MSDRTTLILEIVTGVVALCVVILLIAGIVVLQQ